MKVDILFAAHNRLDFTWHSLCWLNRNTNWDLVNRVYLYDDNSTDGTQDLMRSAGVHAEAVRVIGSFGAPVAIMNDYLQCAAAADVFAKIDSDVIVPPGWLDACVRTMEACPELDLLGIEPPASRTAAPWARGKVPPAPEHSAAPGALYAPCGYIGGVGLMRRRAFEGRAAMKPFATYGGFTNWQQENPQVVKGWITPPLKLFLLDRLAFDPWAKLSREYIAKKWQRPWTNYPPEAKGELWGWWSDSKA